MPKTKSRWSYKVDQLIYPGLVSVHLGIRLTVADSAIFVQLGFIFFEVSIQYNRKDSDAEE